MSLRSPNSSWCFWFPKRLFWKASTQINIGSGDSLVTGPKEVWNWSETPAYSPSQTHCPQWPSWDSSTWRGQLTPGFCDTFLRGKKFTLWLLISKTALLEIKYSNKYWKRAVGIYFLRLPLGEISLRSLNSPKDFWFPKRPCSSSASFPERGRSPWAPPKGSETGLKPFWNTFRLTISDSVLVRLQHHCFILLFISRKDVFFL